MTAGGTEAFFDKLERAYAAAEGACGAVSRCFRIGGREVELRFAGPALVTALGSGLAHLGCTASGPAELTVCSFDSASTATPPPPRPWTNDQVRASGVVEDFSNARFHTVFQVAARLLTVLDRERRLALCWTPDAGDLPMPERAAPLRRLLQAWTADRGTLLVHGGAVGRPDGGVLVVGQGGAGKSTTALACLRSPLLYAADDYCLLDPGPRPWVHSLYCTGKTDVSGLARLPFLAPMVSNRDRRSDEKALCSLHDHVPGALTTAFPLRAVLVPRLTSQPTTTVAPSSPGAMLRALAPTTVLLSPQTAARVLPALADLSRRIPVYELAIGEDASTIPAAIAHLLDALHEEAATRPDRDPVPPAATVA
ncbi:MAG: serine kinase [Acidimicrobiia bacterium]